MPAKTLLLNPKIVMALVLCVSFMVAATFDERAGAEIAAQDNFTQSQTSVPIAE
jgi:hypothetical protein